MLSYELILSLFLKFQERRTLSTTALVLRCFVSLLLCPFHFIMLFSFCSSFCYFSFPFLFCVLLFSHGPASQNDRQWNDAMFCYLLLLSFFLKILYQLLPQKQKEEKKSSNILIVHIDINIPTRIRLLTGTRTSFFSVALSLFFSFLFSLFARPSYRTLLHFIYILLVFCFFLLYLLLLSVWNC